MQPIQIKELAQLCNVSRKTIRYYEEKSLLSPYDRKQGARYYSVDEIMRLKCICFYRSLDMSIKDIQEIMEHKSSKDCLQRVLSRQKDILYNTIEEKIKMRKSIDDFLSYTEAQSSTVNYKELLEKEDTELISDMILWKFNNCYQMYSLTCSKKEYKRFMNVLHVFIILISIIFIIIIGSKALGIEL